MLFYTNNLPSGYSTNARVKALYSLTDAVKFGILNDYADATAPQMTYTITAAGSAGDYIRLRATQITPTLQNTVTIGEYTRVGTETTTQVATALAASINAYAQGTGFTATSSAAVITVTAPKSFGTWHNAGTNYFANVTGAITATIVQNTVAGVASEQAVWYYHISEFFRMNPKGVLYVGFYAIPGTYTFAEITLMQNFAQGVIRQIGIYKKATYADSDIALIDAVCKANDALKKPINPETLPISNSEKEGVERVYEFFKATNKNNNAVGAFFPYYNRTKLNLERYQITDGENGNQETNINKDNCLIYALRLLKVEEEKLLIIKKYVCNGKIPMCKLKDICEDVGIRIYLITEKNDKGTNKNKKVLYGKEGNMYNICCLEEHYFIYDEKTEYTNYFINNYEKLKDVKDGNYIYNNMNQKKKDRGMNSFNLILALLENKEQLLEKIDYTNINLYDEQYKGFIIDEDESNFKDLYFDPKYNAELYEEPEEPKEPKEPKAKPPIIVFDFETYTSKNHIPYCCCSIDENNIKSRFIGEDCGEQLLKSVKSDVILMAHNAKYDMRFIIKHLSKCSEIVNGSSFITFSGYYGKFKIIIKDSYKLIASKAADMPQMFLSKEECKKIKKEVMPYGLYNEQNLIKKYIELDECLKYLKTEEEKEEFTVNCKNWEILINNKVNILEYSLIYCEMDCEILKKCYSVFREWCLNDFKLDIDEILTIPSLAERYFKNCGCFDGCYKLSGLPQLFISRSVVGGRTMMRNNKKEII
jgi:hypothetical protein